MWAGAYITKLGFADVRNEKISQYLKFRRVQNEIERLEKENAFGEQDKDNLSNQDLQNIQKLQRLHLSRDKTSQVMQNLRSELKTLTDHNIILEKIGLEHESYLMLYKDEIRQLNDQIEVFEKEKGSKTLNKNVALKDEDNKEIDLINKKVGSAKNDLRNTMAELRDIQNRVNLAHESVEKTKVAV